MASSDLTRARAVSTIIMKLRGRSIVEAGVMLMRNRSHTVLLSGMVAVTAICAARSLGAQAAKAPAQTPAKAAPARPAATLPRTADGHPDFQGLYDVATVTPVARP